jgi:hypothetical protein
MVKDVSNLLASSFSISESENVVYPQPL